MNVRLQLCGLGFFLAVTACSPPTPAAAPVDVRAEAPQDAANGSTPAAPSDKPPLKQEELDQTLASIALYPDSLLTQILMASTYPLEVVQADRCKKEHASLEGDALSAALEQQSWDPSVKSLINFPEVLAMMGGQIDWTVKLGDAFHAVQVLLAVADAQREYAHSDPDGNGIATYAPKFLSDPGEKNGLYWKAGPDYQQSPLGPLIAGATAEGYSPSKTGAPTPYHGYYFRMLTAQGPSANGGARDYLVNGELLGGFGAVAWPAQVGNSGVMTFIANQDGVVYQRYLGPTTDATAKAMTTFEPTPGYWAKVD